MFYQRFSIYTCLLLLGAFTAYSQTVTIDLSNMKKEKIDKREYELTYEQLFIEFKEDVVFDQLENKTEQDFEVLSQRKNYLILKTKKELSLEEVQTKAYKAFRRENIAYIHPYLKSENGELVSYLNAIVVRLNEGFSEKELKEQLKVLGIKTKKIVVHRHLERVYDIYLKDEEAANTLTVAEKLLQSGMFEYTSPVFYSLLEV